MEAEVTQLPEESRKHPAESWIPFAAVVVAPPIYRVPVVVAFPIKEVPRVEEAELKYWRVEEPRPIRLVNEANGAES